MAQRLIGAGHSWQEVSQYTLAQLELFAAALDREEKARLREALIVARAARGKPDSFKKLLRDLDR